MRGELGDIDGPAAADTGDRLVGAGPKPLAEGGRGGVRAVWHPEDLGRVDLQLGGDAVTLAGADRDGYPALSRDPAVSEQRAQASDGSRPDIDDERRGEHPG